ncbi:MAG: molybdate ABC transporter substrate-binding protein [Planctomycetaceae bacterium]|nr:molybdate ABC transporter substrate-binding protein [Planctomycetaceae bacterium]
MIIDRRHSHPQQLPHTRAGQGNVLWVLIVTALVIIGLSVALLSRGNSVVPAKTQTLTMYAAAGMRTAVEQIAHQYEQEYGTHIDLQYGGSNTLLNQLQVNEFETADLYLAADDFYTDKAVELGLAAEVLPIGHQRAVIAVRKDQKKEIQSLADLLRDDVTVAVANPDQAAIGKATRRLLRKIEVDGTTRWNQLEAAVTQHGVFKPTVNDVSNDIKLGAVDAGIVWETTVAMPSNRDELQAIPVPELEGEPDLISIAVLNSSQQPTAALKFARYLTASDKGLPVFAEFGAHPVDGDIWEEYPQMNFYCGAVNRRVVEDVVTRFEEREGVEINTIYDGCGILTGRMKTIEGQQTSLGFPDVYMACDVYYLDNVREWFQEAANVSDVEIVIAVPKGSDVVRSPDDLIKPGVRVAIGQPEQCTIGALTRRMLDEEGLYDQLIEKQSQPGEVVVEKSSSALLVPDVVTGHVDAAVAYITDVLANEDRVDIVHFTSPLNRAVQPFSIAKSSEHKYLARRLFRQIVDSPDAFKSAGFNYREQEDSSIETTESNLP